jgi:hypothetical protein
LLGGRRRQGVKAQHACVIAHVYAIQRERMEVYVEAQRGVGRRLERGEFSPSLGG